ncbi:hypothetical protein [Streptomyces luteolus]|uniref:Secreted protein n=1 Tax=Streptomyces luteolus TaxID=3043615 RepID=A0ABT6T7A7_9ACTN|nr:hypothetical protein [Streptomyces sp. B-S-A12]MDI3423782.1 hypothetical protein [Streptomyces sp. B-S-A12]
MRRALTGLMGILAAAALALGVGAAAHLPTADGPSAGHEVLAGEPSPNLP